MSNPSGSNQYRRRRSGCHPDRTQANRQADATRWDHLDHLDLDDRRVEDVDRVAAWLRRFPPQSMLVWGQDHETVDGHTVPSWVDIHQVEAPVPIPGYNWIWTVTSPDDPDSDPDDPLNIVVDPDMDVWGIWDANTSWWTERHAVPAGDPAPGDDPLLRCHGGWSVDLINELLHRWATDHAGRPDLRFEYRHGALSKIAQSAVDAYQAIRDGDAEVYDLGDGVQATAAVMDTLLSMDPDDAAAVTNTVKDLMSDIDSDNTGR